MGVVVELEQPLNGSPQLEDGHTRIANELFEAIIRFDFSKRQYKVVLFILRKTYGWRKKGDVMSLSQIVDGTSLHRGHACDCVNELVAMKVLLKREHRNGQYIEFNKIYGEWRLLPKQEHVTETVTKVLPKREQTVTKTVTTKETNTKEKKEIIYAEGVFTVPESHLKVWKAANPNIDVEAEIAKAGAWCLDNPSKRPKSNFSRFLGGWMNRATPKEHSNSYQWWGKDCS